MSTGGGADYWADITEWLILRGAKKVVVSSDNKAIQNHINRRLSLLQTYYECDIIFAPIKSHTKEGAADLLADVQILGPLHSVFALPQSKTLKSSDLKTLQYIDTALRVAAPKALFVSFVNEAAGICQARADSGYSTYNVQWPKDSDFTEALSGLDNILALKVNNVFINNDKVSDSKQESTQALFKSK